MHVVVGDGESIEQALKRFNKGIGNDGILRIYREKMRFESKRDQERRKQARAGPGGAKRLRRLVRTRAATTAA